MSDFSTSSCGCGSQACEAGYFNGSNILWIIILMSLLGGCGCGGTSTSSLFGGCGDSCGCGSNIIWIIILLSLLNGNGSSLLSSGCSNCGCGC